MLKTSPLATASPESQGIPSSAIQAFVDAAEHLESGRLHSFMLLRHGRQVAGGWWDPYGPQHPHMLFSLSKSFTSTAIGLLVQEGKLSIDDPVVRFFPEEVPALASARLQAMRIRHLLTMTTGHAEDTMPPMQADGNGAWARAFLALPVDHEPGTHFLYNTGATYMLSAIVQRLSGMRLLDYLQPRLFAPLEIENPTWEQSPEGIDTGGFGLSIRTADIARFGQLYLQQGEWQGVQLVPKAWIEAATARQVPNGVDEIGDWQQGYGFQFWRCRHGAYRGDGAFGQYCLVMPGQDAVLAMTGGLGDMQSVLDLVWTHLLPAMAAVPLPEDAAAQAALGARLAGLRLAAVAGARTSPYLATVAGKKFIVAPNSELIESFTLDADDHGDCTLVFWLDGRESRIACGHQSHMLGGVDAWRPAQAIGGRLPVAASGAWIDDRTYVAEIVAYKTPFTRTFTLHFGEGTVVVEQRDNVSFAPLETVRLEGKTA